MNILILGAAGFIGTNLTVKFAEDKKNKITVVDKQYAYFVDLLNMNLKNVEIVQSSLDEKMDFSILDGQDIVFHLVSTNVPTNSNCHISKDIQENVLYSAVLFEECVKYNVKKVIFFSSGGTVYGKEVQCPLSEDTRTNPISSYGLQKLTIEKLLYLYHHIYGLDYRIIRLSNPYGPYQRPNGILGAVTTFTYNALKNQPITVYGDGSVIRDFIYIDDAINAIFNVVTGNQKYKTFNIGSGVGISINQLLASIENVLNIKLNVQYEAGRSVDVPVNYLDIGRYEECYGKLQTISLEEGIERTSEFMKRKYNE